MLSQHQSNAVLCAVRNQIPYIKHNAVRTSFTIPDPMAVTRSMARPSSGLSVSPSKKRPHQSDGNDNSQRPAKKVSLPGKLSGIKLKAATVKNTTTSKATTANKIGTFSFTITSDTTITVSKKDSAQSFVLSGLEGTLAMDITFISASTPTKSSEIAGPVPGIPITSKIALDLREQTANSMEKMWSKELNFSGRGLANLTGALCYRHSLFQALFHIPQFVHWLRNSHDPKSGTCVSDYQNECVSCCVRNLAIKYWVNHLPSEKIVSQLKNVDALFAQRGWQPDSFLGHADPEEQFSWMMNKMSAEFPSDCFAQYHAFHQCILQSEIKCGKCHHVSRNGGDCLDFLQVPIKPQVKGNHLETLIENYLDETISGYKCDKCEQKTDKPIPDKQRVQKIVFAPDVLMITLKRFTFNIYGDPQKDNDPVDYDQTLNLSTHRADLTRGSLVYHLKAVISHTGGISTDVGHYHCVAKTPTGKWVDFDDNDMSSTTLDEALDPTYYQSHRDMRRSPWTPYLLFYQRDQTSLP